MTYEEFKQNFLPEFLNINSFAGKLKYATQHLQRLGSGTGRIVFDIDGQKVLKLAKNTKGIAQNEVEANTGYYRDTQHIVTEVFDSADDDSWLIAEKAKKVGENRIKQLTGIPSLDIMKYYILDFVSENNGRGRHYDHIIKPELKEELDNNEFVQDLTEFIMNYSQQPGDYGRPSTFGEVLRDGQPSIVLTDYGLNDEVYDTHYSSNRKEPYRMYELFDAADGNDDILSDIGNTGEVRHGMWALSPYGVSDGTGVMNEDFQAFVSNRDYYPERPLPSMPIVVERFHECIMNLKETLNQVPDKKKFYGNLLKLQEYLIEQGSYDKDRLELQEYDINEAEGVPNVKGGTLEDEAYATQLANAAAEKLGLTQPKLLGGGSNGLAFEINNDLVMKITADVSEADAGMKILRGNPKYIAKVFNIYKLVDTEKDMAFFIILEENIKDKPVQQFHSNIRAIDTISPAGMGFVDILIAIKRADKFDYNAMLDVAQHVLTDNPESGISEADRQNAYKFLVGILEIRKELQTFDIKSWDYSNPENLGYKDGVLKFYDVGGYRAVEPEMGNNVIMLPEGDEMLSEDYDRSTADAVANRIAQLKGYGTPRFIGSGLFGVAYDIGQDKVLKITADKSEAAENLTLIGKPLKYIAQPYAVFSVDFKSPTKERVTYAIVLEKLKTDAAEFRRMYQRMNFAFEKIMNVQVPEVINYYLNLPANDNVDRRMVDKYFAKNPQDAEFFYAILRIAEELESYGIESTDYYNPNNLGYKKSGAIGFFDVGFGNGFLQPQGAEKIEMDEDGSSKFSTSNSVGQDDFPVYNQNDSSPMTDNNIPTSIDERIKTYMPKSSSVEVKKKCRLGGLGNTSVACNQGDIKNLDIKSISEEKNTYLYNQESLDMNEAQIMSLQDLPFKQEVEQLGGKIHSVGGAVRDTFLGKESKDLDILITGIPMDKLEQLLSKYGRVDAVGKSFGVLKFKPTGSSEDIDIAIPRTEKPTGAGGHQGFDVTSDHALPIEKDLERRDFTINAIAKDSEGNIIDPYHGQEDLKNKIIRAVNPQAFSDDPLRMLRAVQFASRFGFNIEPQTMKMIQDSASTIKEIPPERILTEFDKIVKKGNKRIGAQLLKDTGLYENIFGFELNQSVIDRSPFEDVQTMGEYIYLLTRLLPNPAEFYRNNLKGDIDTYKEIRALQMAFESGEATSLIEARSIAHNMYVMSPLSLQSKILPQVIENAAQELLQGKYPKTIGELSVNGNDLMQAGLKGKEVGDALKMMLLKVYSGKVGNDKEQLLSLVGQNKETLKEEKKPLEKIEYGALMLYLDIPIWSKITSVIKKEDIFDQPGFGIEDEPHLTVLYGFHKEVTASDVFELYKKTTELKPIEVRIKGISIFENPDFDVVKFDVNSKILADINDTLRQLPNTTKFPEYHAHITLAYVKKGEGKKYVRPFEKERIIIGDKLVFSTKGGDKETLKLNEKGLLKEEYREVEDGKYLLNNQIVNMDFFIRKYDEWNNQAGYPDPSEESVLSFLQNNYEDFSHNENLKKELLWALTDREVLNENL